MDRQWLLGSPASPLHCFLIHGVGLGSLGLIGCSTWLDIAKFPFLCCSRLCGFGFFALVGGGVCLVVFLCVWCGLVVCFRCWLGSGGLCGASPVSFGSSFTGLVKGFLCIHDC